MKFSLSYFYPRLWVNYFFVSIVFRWLINMCWSFSLFCKFILSLLNKRWIMPYFHAILRFSRLMDERSVSMRSHTTFSHSAPALRSFLMQNGKYWTAHWILYVVGSHVCLFGFLAIWRIASLLYEASDIIKICGLHF